MSPKQTPKGCSLEEAARMIKGAIPYVDGSATVTFQITNTGLVSAFRLTNNHDSRRDAPES